MHTAALRRPGTTGTRPRHSALIEDDLPAIVDLDGVNPTQFEPTDELPFGAMRLVDVPTDPPPPLFIDRLDPLSQTLLFAYGGTGKGTVASLWIAQLVTQGHRVLILDYENHPDEWSRRIEGFGTTKAREAVTIACPHDQSWTGTRGAIWDQIREIKAIKERVDATYVVIDSIVAACKGVDASTGNTDAPSAVSAALQELGIPSLLIGHVPNEGSMSRPFGSAFWMNFARMAWSLEKVPNTDQLKLTNRKHNNYPTQPVYVIEITWVGGLPMLANEKTWTASIIDQVRYLLSTHRQPMTDKQLADAIGPDDMNAAESKRFLKSVQKALQRAIEKGELAKADDQYALKYPDTDHTPVIPRDTAEAEQIAWDEENAA